MNVPFPADVGEQHEIVRSCKCDIANSTHRSLRPAEGVPPKWPVVGSTPAPAAISCHEKAKSARYPRGGPPKPPDPHRHLSASSEVYLAAESQPKTAIRSGDFSIARVQLYPDRSRPLVQRMAPAWTEPRYSRPQSLRWHEPGRDSQSSTARSGGTQAGCGPRPGVCVCRSPLPFSVALP
jgi:hypothetical protein